MISKNLILMGMPGSGKGTLAKELIKISKLKHISTGNILRNEIQNKTELGKLVEEIMVQGKYVSDDILNEMVKKTLLDAKENNELIILDGYPRTINQAKFLDSLNIEFKIVELVAPLNLITKRLSGRRECPKCKASYNVFFQPPKQENKCDLDAQELVSRKDDNAESIAKRLEIFKKETSPLFEYYKSKNNLVKISSESNPKLIAIELLKSL
ncbi:adenylate kinase family protein [Mycoplasmopsis synoviae]|uniref:adenylate kinase family protein n=1 Tax=Mycoplasmopsis synoviae TaxID=2109 RepID=UPI001CE06819|nr:nucleoside monophosphate kinase [Mycoplasmopsis synoviae]UBX98212.1 nucleoside monophosphate kinase [Mycoplasmopsis synoviae]